LREPLLRAVRRLQEDARRGGGQEPQERHEEPEGPFEDGGERGDGAARAHDLQPARPLRLLPDDRRRRGGGRLPRGPGAILHGHAGVAPRDRARGRLGSALLQAELPPRRRPGRRAAGEGCEDRPRPQPRRPGRDLVRVDPEQRGVRRAAAAAVALLALACCARAADPPGSPRANQALAVCLAAAASPEERRANLARGLALAEEAVAADERDAKAHFAVFCNLGNDVKLRGVAVTSLFAVRRLRREIDRTLELAPDYADALVGKGEFLCELPRLLGGDAAEG